MVTYCYWEIECQVSLTPSMLTPLQDRSHSQESLGHANWSPWVLEKNREENSVLGGEKNGLNLGGVEGRSKYDLNV